MDHTVRKLVHHRAKGCCEYCHLPQAAATFFTFHVEHIRAKQHGGGDEPSNLALACPDCNRFKGPNLTSVDPQSDEVVSLFHPRDHSWAEHFVNKGSLITGKTSIGRATVQLLRMNEEERVQVRTILRDTGDL